MPASIDVIRRVCHDSKGYFMEVAPDAEIGAVMLRTVAGEHSEGFWGVIDVTFDREFARALGQALIAAADDPAL